jgi:hypothetical protein
MRHKKIAFHIALTLIYLTSVPSIAMSKFCDERSTKSYHSPLCGYNWVVKDPQRIDNVKIAYHPPYHTYSRWLIDNETYIFAYRDIDYDPSDMTVDIYLSKNDSHVLIGSVAIGGYIVDVFTTKLTSKILQDIVFRYDNGQLQYVTVVKLADFEAKEVFYYGASTIEVKNGPKPTIVAKSNISNTVEIFSWDTSINKFVKVREYPWYKGKKQKKEQKKEDRRKRRDKPA